MSTAAQSQAADHSSTSPKAQEVFAIPELLENIILQVGDANDVLSCQRVNKTFESAIKSSVHLRWLQPFQYTARKLPPPGPLMRGDFMYGEFEYTNCINPFIAALAGTFAFDINPLETRKSGYWKIENTIMSTVEGSTPTYTIGCRMTTPRIGETFVTNLLLLDMRFAHPGLKISFIVPGPAHTRYHGVIKPTTTVREFFKWCGLPAEEKMRTGGPVTQVTIEDTRAVAVVTHMGHWRVDNYASASVFW